MRKDLESEFKLGSLSIHQACYMIRESTAGYGSDSPTTLFLAE